MDTGNEALLIVDPDLGVAEGLTEYLASRGYAIDTSADREHALRLASSRRYSAFIIGLSHERSETSVCHQLRSDLRLGAPIVVVSESAALATKLRAFQDGADDYLVKPLSPVEVELRIGNRILRSKARPHVAPLRVGDLVLDRRTRSVERAGVALKLTPTTFRILELLMLASPRTVSRTELLHDIWQGDGPESDALRSHLYALRKQVNRPSLPPLMRTVRMSGIQLAELPSQSARLPATLDLRLDEAPLDH